MKHSCINIFRNYPQPDDYVPDNYPKCIKPLKLDILAGELAVHTFEVPLNVEELEGLEVIYKLGVKPIVIKDMYQVEYIVDEFGKTTINCTLYPHETRLFAHSFLNASVQLKFYMADDMITYSEPYRITVTTALDVGRKASDGKNKRPEPTDIVANVGLGYKSDLEAMIDDKTDEDTTDDITDDTAGENTVIEKPTSGLTSAGYGYTED